MSSLSSLVGIMPSGDLYDCVQDRLADLKRQLADAKKEEHQAYLERGSALSTVQKLARDEGFYYDTEPVCLGSAPHPDATEPILPGRADVMERLTLVFGPELIDALRTFDKIAAKYVEAKNKRTQLQKECGAFIHEVLGGATLPRPFQYAQGFHPARAVQTLGYFDVSANPRLLTTSANVIGSVPFTDEHGNIHVNRSQ